MKEYTSLPAADFNGNAGNMAPGEREQRYKAYAEKPRLARTSAEEAKGELDMGGK